MEETRPAHDPRIGRIRGTLLRWYRRSRRDLPWRRTTDPYRIWVSEVMLQQTRVTTVLSYYDRFIERFPDLRALADATEDEVLALWSGLGYYRRARLLHAGARAVVSRHDGRVPADPRSLRALPGVGRYTAGAIASIAFNLPEPVLDGNVRRVLSRLFVVDGNRLGRAAEERACWGIAGALANGGGPGDLNQALMELGATVCLPSGPDCGRCPVRRVCGGRSTGRPEAYPTRRPRSPTLSVTAAVALVRRSGRLLLERPGRDSPLRGRWDLPARESDARAGSAAEALGEQVARVHGLELKVGAPVAHVVHGIMNRRLTLAIHPCRHLRGRVSDREALTWVEVSELDRVAVSGATKKIVRAVFSNRGADLRYHHATPPSSGDGP